IVLVLATVAISSGSAFAQSWNVFGPSGGYGGEEFKDGLPGGNVVFGVRIRVSRIIICSGWYIDSITFFWQRGSGPAQISGVRHGGNGGRCSTYIFANDERILSVRGNYGQFVDRLIVSTPRRDIVHGGAGGSARFSYSAWPGGAIVGLSGRSGVYLDAIGTQI